MSPARRQVDERVGRDGRAAPRGGRALLGAARVEVVNLRRGEHAERADEELGRRPEVEQEDGEHGAEHGRDRGREVLEDVVGELEHRGRDEPARGLEEDDADEGEDFDLTLPALDGYT